MLVNRCESITCREKVANVMILKNREGKGEGDTSLSDVDLRDSPLRMGRTADPSARAASPSGAKAPDYRVLGRDDKVDEGG